MLGFGGLFKSRANYVFDYKPRYYDERKERIENLKKKYEGIEDGIETNGISLSKEKLKKEWSKNKHFAHDKGVTIRLAIIITAIVSLIFWAFELHKLDIF
jgi:hypothetical protein